MLIFVLWGVSFPPAVVVCLGNDLFLNSILGHCEWGRENLLLKLHDLYHGDNYSKPKRVVYKSSLVYTTTQARDQASGPDLYVLHSNF